MVLQKQNRGFQNRRLVHFPGIRAHHTPQLVDQHIELISALFLAQITRFSDGRKLLQSFVRKNTQKTHRLVSSFSSFSSSIVSLEYPKFPKYQWKFVVQRNNYSGSPTSRKSARPSTSSPRKNRSNRGFTPLAGFSALFRGPGKLAGNSLFFLVARNCD